MLLRGILSDRSPYRKFLIVVGITLICSVIFTLLGSLMSALLFGINPMSNPGILQNTSNPDVVSVLKTIQFFAAIGTFIIPPFLTAFLFDLQPSSYLGLKKTAKIQIYILLFLLMMAIVPFINWMLVVNSTMHLPESLKFVEEWMKNSEAQAAKLTEMFLNTGTISGLAANLIIIAIIPAIGEELLFRGVIQRLFKELSGNIHVAVILTAILFSAMHMQFYGFFPRFALGILLGYLYFWSGSLWLPMFAHFINNSSAVIFAWLATKNNLPVNQDTIGTQPGEEMILATSVFLCWAILFVIYKSLRKETSFIK